MSDDFGAIAELGAAAAVEAAASAVAARGAKTSKCRNCGAPVFASYCAMCGQEHETHRHTLRFLLRHLFADMGSFDNRLLRTIVALLFRPGELPTAFHDGRTRRYMPSVRLYLYSSLLFFLTLSATGIALVQIELREVPNAYTVRALPNGAIVLDSNGHVGSPMPAITARQVGDKSLSPGVHSGLTTAVHFFSRIGRFHQKITPEGWARIAQLKANILHAVGNDPHGWMARNALASVEKLARDPAALNVPLTTWIPRVFFLLLPLFALLLAIFYWRQRKQFYFVDHLVFSLSIHSFVFAILILAIGAAQLLPGARVAQLILLAIGIYLFVAMKRFYGQGWFITSSKFVLITFIYTIFFLVPALVFVLVTGVIEG